MFLLDFSTTVMLSCLGAVLAVAAPAAAGDAGLAGAAGAGIAAAHPAQSAGTKQEVGARVHVTSRTRHCLRLSQVAPVRRDSKDGPDAFVKRLGRNVDGLHPPSLGSSVRIQPHCPGAEHSLPRL